MPTFRQPIFRAFCREPLRAWAEIDLSALRNNFRLLRDAVKARDPHTRLIAVVKADAYGHGLSACVRALLEEGCDAFAVFRADEAFLVRSVCWEEKKDARILVLGYSDPSQAVSLAASHALAAIPSLESAEALSRAATEAGVTLSVQIALDTGMNRIGLAARGESDMEDAVKTILRIATLPSLSVEGLFTHLSSADDEEETARERTLCQQDRFHAVADALAERGLRIPFLHICNSAAAVRGSASCMDGVRMGILLYGPYLSCETNLALRPVMRLCAPIVQLHEVRAGERIGYGGAYVAERDMTVATLPIGYADGLLRAYSGAEVTLCSALGKRRARIVGRICMDQCMLDVTGCDAAVGDPVELFGGDGTSLPLLAAHAGTIPYESLCLISSRVPRVYLQEQEHENA